MESPDRGKDNRAMWALVLAFSALELWLRFPILTGAVALYERDLFSLYFPLVQGTLRDVANGALPLRDPTSAFGQPLLADPSCQILYPPTWLHLLTSPPVAYGWFVSLHSVFGALGVGLLCRKLSGGSFAASVVGGVAWLISGPLQSLASLWHHMSGAAWIPWVLLEVERVLESPDRRGAIRLGAVVGAQMLAGSADMCAMTLLIAALRILLAGGWRRPKAWLMSGVIAVVLSAGVWLPALGSLVVSARAALPESTRTYWSLHPLTTIEFFLPLPLAVLPLTADLKAAMYESREPFLGSMFLGAMVLPLFLAAIFDSNLPRTLRIAFTGSALVGFLVALGKNSVAYSVLVTVIPPLGIFRFPSKAMVPVTVLLCLFAGIGVRSIQRSGRSRTAALFGIFGLAAAALLLLGPLGTPLETLLFGGPEAMGLEQFHRNFSPDLLVTLALLAFLTAFVLRPQAMFLVGCVLLGSIHQSAHILRSVNPTAPITALAYKPPHIEQVRPPGHGRVMVYEYSMLVGAPERYLGTDSFHWTGLEELGYDVGRVAAQHSYPTPLTGGLWGFEYAWDADLRRLFDHRLAFLTKALRASEGTPAFLRLLQLSGVERVVALHEKGLEDLRPLSRHRVFHREPLRVFEVPGALPGAHLTSGRRRTSGSDLTDILDPAFDPLTTVLVDDGPERAATPGFAGTASLVDRKADRLTVVTSSDRPGFLTVLEGVLPGWHVWIDGKRGKVERANAIFIGTEVPAGTHRIEFRFLPATAVVGVSLTVIAALGLLHVFVTSLRSRR